MKKNLLVSMIIVLVVSVLSFSGEIFAATNSLNSANTSSTTGNYVVTESNAYLSNLGITPNDFSGFRYATMTYDVTVPENVDEIEVYATPMNANAEVTGTGTKTLEAGKNTFEVTVTSEDGTKTNTYTINVTRQGDASSNTTVGTTTSQTTSEEEEDGLDSLRIGDLDLSPKFSTNVYEYTAKYVGQETSLSVQAVATDASYKVEVTGNQDLKEGDNLITIVVSDTNGENVATYQVTLNKSIAQEPVEEAINEQDNTKMYIIAGVVGVVIIILIIYLIVRHKRRQAWAEEYTVPYTSSNGDDFIDDDNYDNYNNQYENEDEDNGIVKTKEMREQEKERIRKQFLDNYNNNEDDRPKKKNKGKRFK